LTSCAWLWLEFDRCLMCGYRGNEKFAVVRPASFGCGMRSIVGHSIS